MRAAVALGIVLVGLAGCDSLFTLTTDAYEPGNREQSAFFRDGEDCKVQAGNTLDVESQTEAGERREIFNRAFDRCMRGLGYQRRGLRPGNYNL